MASGRLGCHRTWISDQRADCAGYSAGRICRIDDFSPAGNSRKNLLAGLLAGFALFLILAAPWFLAVFQRVPQSAHYMILGQAAGHLLGTTIKNRPGSPFYFFGILAVGIAAVDVPAGLVMAAFPASECEIRNPKSGNLKDGWLLLNAWAIFTFTLFSFSQAKLPAYILPIFPALAVLLALRFFTKKAQPGLRSMGLANLPGEFAAFARDFSVAGEIRFSTTSCRNG